MQLIAQHQALLSFLDIIIDDGGFIDVNTTLNRTKNIHVKIHLYCHLSSSDSRGDNSISMQKEGIYKTHEADNQNSQGPKPYQVHIILRSLEDRARVFQKVFNREYINIRRTSHSVNYLIGFYLKRH